MIDPREQPFLTTIAENPRDQTARLVYADWLEEHDQAPRAEFIRIQCELAGSRMKPIQYQSLRVRERDLLNEHRSDWCESLGFPIDDARFERGLLAQFRPREWHLPTMVSGACQPALANLVELDLSNMQLTNADLATLAEMVRWPNLRKLILSGNQLTMSGVEALAGAKGLPSLETVYLFGNSLDERARDRLLLRTAFQLKKIDLGECPDGYCMSAGQTELARRDYLRLHLIPFVRNYFTQYPLLQSAMLCVAQFWNDEADDAVHGQLVVSERYEPVVEGVGHSYEDDHPPPDPNLPNTKIVREYGETGSVVSIWPTPWDDNGEAIPVWAAYSPEEGSQEYSELSEVFAPAVLIFRHEGYEMQPMIRPHLNGVRPEWGWDDRNE